MTKFYYPVTTNVHIIIYDVIYGIDDKVKFTWSFCGNTRKTRYSKIQHDKAGRSYFKSCNRKIYLDECIGFSK